MYFETLDAVKYVCRTHGHYSFLGPPRSQTASTDLRLMGWMEAECSGKKWATAKKIERR